MPATGSTTLISRLKSIPKDEDLFTISLDKAIDLLKPIRKIGDDPEKKGSVDKGMLAYYVTLEIDGVSGDFLLDTGAMGFSIGKKMFERLKGQGIEFLDLNKKVASVGVGGESQGKLILLNNVKIGNYTLSNVVASVSLENNFSLLGTGFLLKFSNVIWNMKKETLILYK